MAVVAITSDDAVLADRERRLQTHRDRFLTDVEVAEAADQPKPVELPGLLLEPADEKHLPVEINQLLPARLVPIWFVRPFAIGCRRGRGTACALRRRGFSGTSGRRGFRRSEEHTSELQSLMRISYAVFCLKKKKMKEQQ